ncbi:MAG TPA: FadR/GntR family transcriptional regulator [Anaerolineales bacterium]|nr:FadR/GntR family transcriptional regulator [Anaerolineales bacterium]HNA88262.1 FadR/GntR family transcriptional regulator [Anaerolineales bacterium]HNB35809.1 FadR/GntR family transcriptional regulator [Anaerolineales bacterium]HNC08500.1 FadR/GntR family transcriptional regulator [Anaerolineales bacterium]
MSDELTNLNSIPEGAAIEPLEREQRLYERVVDKVLELISSGAWKPGFRLPPERELSEAFGVSRTVVREAVKALEARGVLESTTGSGVSVRHADFNMVSQSLKTYMQLTKLEDFEIRLNEVRQVLEVEMVALAANRISTEQKKQLRKICKEMRESDNTSKQMAELDFRLHVTLAEATQNELFKVLLAPLINQLRDQIILTWEDFPRPVSVVLDQHEAIVTAVESGDTDGARQAMAKHLAFSRKVLEDISQAQKDQKS